MEKRVAAVITSSVLLQKGTPIIIGVSGGSDSICLLHVLSVLFPSSQRIAVYVDHGLRPHETASEKQLVREQAETCSAHFETVTIDVQKEQKETHCSLEEAARNLRYQALEEMRTKYQATTIAIGHTADDQAEEILLRLIRGCGSSGLSGMKICRGAIIRPLLHEPKEELHSYLESKRIPFCEDSSNADTRFLRNKIRLDLLPKLESEYNKSIRQTLLHTAAVLTKEDTLLQSLTNEAFDKLVFQTGDQLTLNISLFVLEPLAIQRRICEKICWTLQSKPSFKKIESIIALATATEQKEIHLSGGLRAVCEGKTLLFHRPSRSKSFRGSGRIRKTFFPITIPSPGTYAVTDLNRHLVITRNTVTSDLAKSSDTLIVDAQSITFPLVLRHHHTGERFHPYGAPGRKKISRFFSDHKIPSSMRDTFPVLVNNEHIIAIVGLRIDQKFCVRKATKHVLGLNWEEGV